MCFSPERIDPGNEIYNTSNTPKVIGGITDKCSEVGKELYSKIIKEIVVVSSTETAEMVKLLENTFRAINIGLANGYLKMIIDHVVELIISSLNDYQKSINASLQKDMK